MRLRQLEGPDEGVFDIHADAVDAEYPVGRKRVQDVPRAKPEQAASKQQAICGHARKLLPLLKARQPVVPLQDLMQQDAI